MRNSIALPVLFVSAAAATLVGCSQRHSGVVTIDGSDTVYPLSKAMADAFHQSNPGVRFDVQFSGTGGGFRKFCAGQVEQNTRFEKGVTGSALGGHGSVIGIVHDWFNTDDEEKVKAQLVQ